MPREGWESITVKKGLGRRLKKVAELNRRSPHYQIEEWIVQEEEQLKLERNARG